MTTTAVGQDTRLHQLARLVETAETVRNRYTSIAYCVAGYYAPVVHLWATATFLGWWIASGDPWHALNIAMAVLIINCPCALGLAVPTVSTAAIGRLYALGFLVKSGTALERLASVDEVLLDKTGTLTRTGFKFDVSPLSATDQSIAKALAQASSHPVARALDDYLESVASAAFEDCDCPETLVSERPVYRVLLAVSGMDRANYWTWERDISGAHRPALRGGGD